MSLRSDLYDLVTKVYEWAGRPTRDGAKNLRQLASEIEERNKKTHDGLVAVFYDRRNDRNVKSSQLMKTNFVQTYVTCDPDDDLGFSGRRISEMGEPMTKEQYDYYLANNYFKVGDEHYKTPWEEWRPETIVKYPHWREEQIGSLGYKSEKCPEYQNWDLYCNTNDLVFLRFENAEQYSS